MCGVSTARAAACLTATDPGAGTASAATGFQVYQAMGLDQPFMLLGSTATLPFCPVDTNQTVRWYMVSVNSAGTSAPSAILTNIAVTPPPSSNGVLSLSAPSMSTLSVPVGATVTISGDFRNVGNGPLTINAGVLNILAPGATTVSGPYITVISIPMQTIAAGSKVTITGSWTGTAPTGTGWNAYLAANLGGTWTAGPLTPFSVAAGGGPPAAPTNLRFSAIGTTSGTLTWAGDATAKTEVEESLKADPFKRIATVAEGTMRYTRTNLRRARDYAWRVREVKAGFPPSDYSNTAIR